MQKALNCRNEEMRRKADRGRSCAASPCRPRTQQKRNTPAASRTIQQTANTRSGPGKSTTMKMITGLLDKTGGRILFHGEPVERDWRAFADAAGVVRHGADLRGRTWDDARAGNPEQQLRVAAVGAAGRVAARCCRVGITCDG